MSRSRRSPLTPPNELLSQDGNQKAVLSVYPGTVIIADYYRHVGAMNPSGWWKWDRQAEVRLQPLDAALTLIQRIVDTPFPTKRR